jgi:hypothetical protein
VAKSDAWSLRTPKNYFINYRGQEGKSKRILLKRNELSKDHDSGTPAACLRGGIPKVQDKAGAGQNGANDFTLHADAAAVNHADCPESQAMGLNEVFLYNSRNVAGRNTVEIEDIGDGNSDRFFFHETQKAKSPVSQS